MKIYTKTGDTGTTFLKGERISKTADAIEVQGDLDELNAWIGMVREVHGGRDLEKIQVVLLELCAELATGKQRVTQEDINYLERLIDQMELDLPKLRTFILPAGTGSASVHVARAVCRRAERRLIGLMEKTEQTDMGKTIPYLNRLSDYLFMLARKVRGFDEAWTSRIDT